MVEDFFAWVKEQLSQCTVPPKSKTGQGLQYLVNQELYLKVFLTDGDVPIDNSASERSIRTFCIGKKNWMFHNTANGASANAMVYSISETAKLNSLRPYYYFRHIKQLNMIVREQTIIVSNCCWIQSPMIYLPKSSVSDSFSFSTQNTLIQLHFLFGRNALYIVSFI